MLFDCIPLIINERFTYQSTDGTDTVAIKSKQSSENLCYTQRPPEFA